MDTTAQPSTPPASPLRLLTAFLEQLRKLKASLSDHGSLWEIRFMQRKVEAVSGAVATSHSEAAAIDTTLGGIRQRMLADLSPTDDTPGILDRAESAGYVEELSRLNTTAHTHQCSLKRLI